MSFSHSSATTETKSTTQNTSKNLNLQDTAGVTVAGDIGGNITLTDQGAIKEATKIAGYGLDNASAANASAISFGKSALDTVSSINLDSIKLLGQVVSGALDISKTAQRDSAQQSREVATAAVQGNADLAAQAQAGVGGEVSKVAIYALLAIAAIFVLPKLFNGAKGALA